MHGVRQALCDFGLPSRIFAVSSTVHFFMKRQNLKPMNPEYLNNARKALVKTGRALSRKTFLFFQKIFNPSAVTFGNQDSADRTSDWERLTKGDGTFFQRLEALRLITKIRIGLVILFTAITILGMVGGYYVQRTSNNAILMIQDNYNTINYANEMLKAMNDMVYAVTLENSSPQFRRTEFRKASDHFRRYLNLMSEKVSESEDDGGEEEAITERLREDFEYFRKDLSLMEPSSEVPVSLFMKKKNMEEALKSVHDLNEKIIRQRTEEASDIANRVTLIMISLGLFFFVFALFAMFFFPHYISNPIQRLTQSIREIAQKNYSQRVEVEHSDELGEMAHSFNLMAEKLEEYESINVAQILTEKKRTETIVNRMNETIIGLDAQKRVLFANPPALQLLGLKEEELIGKDANTFSEKHELLQNLLKEILSDKVQASQTIPAISIDKDGKRQYFNKDILKIDSLSDDESQKTNVGYVVILKNVTSLKEQDLAKTNFMATLSHELKTPISAIGMSLKLLEDSRVGPLNQEQWELTGTIRQNANRLLKMVNEILDISKIESGKLHLELEAIQADEVVVRALNNVKTFISEKGVKVIQNIEPELPTMKLDVPKTTAVLTNFLTNALRYTPHESTIEIDVMRENGSIEFYVKDEGPGISADEQKKLFQPYRRASGDKTKGTGLGLAISKEFVEAQGGHIWVESEVGEGSRFGFAIPVEVEG